MTKSPVLGSCIIVFQLDWCDDCHLPKNLNTITATQFAYYTFTSNKLIKFMYATHKTNQRKLQFKLVISCLLPYWY